MERSLAEGREEEREKGSGYRRVGRLAVEGYR